ncbi:MAG: DUF45 domain-containing protein [Candidatus Obscuribacterales bacterium]|nr:DUF45 domain-containing protein [Candidatus Obscuribacterales bacterium]
MSNKYTSKYSVNRHNSAGDGPSGLDNSTLEMYQSFMNGYVGRINESTFKVTFGGVRIGSAKYSRLAQINLKSRIITFSRYAIENVPERGRRYLVIHELAHVLEASHNKRFWELVERFEPNYKHIGKQLDLAFKRNVREEQLNRTAMQVPNPITGRLELPKLLLGNPTVGGLVDGDGVSQLGGVGTDNLGNVLIIEDDFDCLDFDFEDDGQFGTVSGGVPVIDGVASSA